MLAIGRAPHEPAWLLLLDEPVARWRAIVKQIFQVDPDINREAGRDGLPGRTERLPCAAPCPPRLRDVNGQITLSGTGRDLLGQFRVAPPISRRALVVGRNG